MDFTKMFKKLLRPFKKDILSKYDRNILLNMGALIAIDFQNQAEPANGEVTLPVWKLSPINDHQELKDFLEILFCASSVAYTNYRGYQHVYEDGISAIADTVRERIYA